MASSGYGCPLLLPLTVEKCHICPRVCLLPYILFTCYFFFSLTRAAQSLEKEVQEVKATLQTMLAQLKEEEEEEEEEGELQDDDLMKNGTEEEEEEEDQYFSDSWGIWNG